jgi:hypothetical protein
LLLLDVLHLLVVLEAVVSLAVVDHDVVLIERDLLEFFLGSEDVFDRFGSEIAFVFLLAQEDPQIVEIFEGLGFVSWEVIFDVTVPS